MPHAQLRSYKPRILDLVKGLLADLPKLCPRESHRFYLGQQRNLSSALKGNTYYISKVIGYTDILEKIFQTNDVTRWPET